MEPTSLEAYRTITSNGMLSRLKMETYKLLAAFGPCTENELREKAKTVNQGAGFESLESLHKRLPELREMKVVRELGRRKCRVSGHECIIWDVTSSLPVEAKRNERKTRTQLLLIIQNQEQRIEELQKRITQFNGQPEFSGDFAQQNA